MTSRPIEDYIEHADELAQEVVNAWGMNVRAGNAAKLTADFRRLLEAACQYRTAKQIADSWREYSSAIGRELSDPKSEAAEKAMRESFAEAYKKFWDEHHQP